MKLIRKSPVFLLLVSTGLLFTIIGIAGRFSIYRDQAYDPVKAPILSVMFTGINENIYPWELFSHEDQQVMAQSGGMAEEDADGAPTEAEQEASSPQPEQESGETQAEAAENMEATPQPEVAEESAPPAVEPELTEEAAAAGIPLERLDPLRESTREEYLNHISADIYGDAGVVRAAAYDFIPVDESYFDDALFIGDSRTVGLRDYTDLSEHADFYCETSLTIYKVMEENFKGKGTIADALSGKEYGKIYLMVGINELGRGTTEDYMAKYTEVVDTLHELEPEAKIFMQGNMRVSGKKDAEDTIFNNSNINARNNAIATLADNCQFFYIDMNEAVCDENGNLNAEYTFDQIHLLGRYNELWKEFLLAHGVN